MKKYMDIERLKDKYRDVFTIGENIVIEEKVDGANASFTTYVDDDGNCTVKAFSRNTELSEENDLRGFYGWSQQIPATRLNELTE
jgi:phosphoribosylamine-glycine ligase